MRGGLHWGEPVLGIWEEGVVVEDVLGFLSVLVLLATAWVLWRTAEHTRDGALSARDGVEHARRKATIDMIERVESTPHYRRMQRAFSSCHQQPEATGGFEALIDPSTDADWSRRRAVLDFLNHYELIAVGIEAGIFDFDLYKSWMGSTMVRDWNVAAAFIDRERWVLTRAAEPAAAAPSELVRPSHESTHLNARILSPEAERAESDDAPSPWRYHRPFFEAFERTVARIDPDCVKIGREPLVPPQTPRGPSDQPFPDPAG